MNVKTSSQPPADRPQQSCFANGVRVISRYFPGAHSVALGVWLLNGSRHEEPDESGYAHLLEHLLFKGTATHKGSALAERFAAMGGQINGHTGRELSALQGVVPADDAPALVDLLLAMLLQPRFTDADVQQEWPIQQQEQQEFAENSEESVEEWAISQAWQGHPLGRPILGEPASGTGVTAARLRDYLRRFLQGERVLVAATGAIPHEVLVRHCAPLAELPRGQCPVTTPPRFRPGIYWLRAESTASQLLWLMPTPGAADPAYPVLLLAHQVLGGGAHAYLFRELRERLGLVYQVYSRLEFYSDAGLWVISIRCPSEQVGLYQGALEAGVSQFMQWGSTRDQIELARRELCASLLIEEDRLENLMERMAREAIYLRRPVAIEEWVRRLGEVDLGQIVSQLEQAWAQRLFVAG